jgi:hypothetical protein
VKKLAVLIQIIENLRKTKNIEKKMLPAKKPLAVISVAP